jgi:predicted nucleic acid-binding protein
MSETTDWAKREEYIRIIRNELRPNSLTVTAKTAGYYGRLIGRIWTTHPPKGASVGTDAHLALLGVDVNDVWIAAQSIEHNLRLVTTDGMACIRAAAEGLLDDAENWVD